MNTLFSTSRTLLRPPTSQFLSLRTFSYDHVVIGAGVVGLAVAAKLAESQPPSQTNRQLTCRREKSTNLIIERNSSIGQETSSRNSEGTQSLWASPRS